MGAYKPREIIIFVKLKFIIRSSYMLVHTCCCIGVFVLCGFYQKVKRNSESICAFRNLERKNKRNFCSLSLSLPFLAFGLLAQPVASSPHLLA
jgi:hypothetical protein